MTALLSTRAAPALPGVPLARAVTSTSGRAGRAALWPVAALLGVSLLLSLALLVFRPIANGHEYQLGLRVTALISVTWGVCMYRPRWLNSGPFLWLIFAAGVYCMVSRPLTLQKNSEIVAAYGSAFAALDAGKNPYDSGSIVHFDEHGEHKLGNFNYPPVELLPYFAVAKLAGHWDHRVLFAMLLVLQLGACVLLWITFPGAPRGVVLAFMPFLIGFELHTNVALTLLAVALVMYLICRPAAPGGARSELLLTLVFGVALLTKFMVIPLFATYVVHRLPSGLWRHRRERRVWRACWPALATAAAALGVAAVVMLPFGIRNVFRETLLFNLVLSERSKLTTFYPNALSGTLTWLGVPGAFPLLAVALLGAALCWGRRLPLLHAMLFSGAVFLLVSPTPEPQYVPVLVYLALCAALHSEAHTGRPRRAESPRLARPA